ncbi:MAG TPA: 50S ribosomal protein L24, partial [Candidatus Latescibacteria bacterium]|nr:50S ribosomal protein L24 [Candidatus Latescibacterota bacterium]
MDIRKGDSVQVISGNDKGRRSTVLNVFKDRDRVIVEGVNMRKHHTRPTSRDPQGGIIERETPIHISNIMVVCPKTDQPTRISHKRLDNGKHV